MQAESEMLETPAKPVRPLATTKRIRGVNPLLALCLFYAALPYIGIGPVTVPSQVQPWAALFGWSFALYRLCFRGLTLNVWHVTMLIFALFFMFDVYQGQQFDISVYLRRSTVFFMSFGIVMAGQYVTPLIMSNVLKVVAPLWLLFGILRYVSATAYFAIVRPLVPTVVESAARGSSSLAPEATDAGFTMSMLLLIAMITNRCLKIQGRRASIFPIVMFFGTMVLTASGTGIFSFVAIIFLYLFSLIRGSVAVRALIGATLAFVILPLAYLLLLGVPETGLRGLDLLSMTVQNPAALLNTTFSYRVLHNAVGIVSLYDSRFLGFGAGSFLTEAPRIYSDYNLGEFFGLSGYYATNVPLTLSQSPISYFSVIFLEYGLVGIIYIGIVFGTVARSSIPLKGIALTMLFLTWAQSFPAAWPPFWIVLGLSVNHRFSFKGYKGAKLEQDG